MNDELFGIWTGDSGQKFGPYTYSQHGEDMVVQALIKEINLEKPSYLDLGAYHPIRISNTALLYKNGSRGVNVEANPSMIKHFYRMRPDDINICIGVSPQGGMMPFYMECPDSVLNSFKKESFLDHPVTHKYVQDLETMSLNEIVIQYCDRQFPDILFTDIEGLDFEILEGVDFTHSKPKIICTEIKASERNDFLSMMRTKGFKYIFSCVSNLFLIESSLYDQGLWKLSH